MRRINIEKKLLFLVIVCSCFDPSYCATKLTESNWTFILDCTSSTSKILYATSKNNDYLNLATMSSDGSNEQFITNDTYIPGVYGKTNLNEIPKYSSDGTKVYYYENRINGAYIYRINSDGSNKVLIVNLVQDNEIYRAFLSPDESKIAYFKKDENTQSYTLWTINTDGTGNTQISNAYPRYYNGIDFTGDSQWVVFLSTYPEYLYKIGVNNTNLTRLTTSEVYADYISCSPDGTKVLYQESGDICSINLDGSNRINLTNDSYTSYDSYPCWSPDGTKISWRISGNTQNNQELWIMDSSGVVKTKIAEGPIMNNIWSKSGNSIYYGNMQNIYTINLDGSNNARITNNSLPIINGLPSWSKNNEKILYTPIYFSSYSVTYEIKMMNSDGSQKQTIMVNPSYLMNVKFSPLSNKIIFEESSFQSVIYSVDLDGANLTILDYGRNPVCSPVENKIAYYSDNNLIVMDLDTLTKKTIAGDVDGYKNYSWSPDGQKLVYISESAPSFNVYTVEISSWHWITQITADSKSYEDPVFSPNGEKIAFTDFTSGKIFVVNADGTDKKEITSFRTDASKISWPKSGRIFYLKNNSLYSIKSDGTDVVLESEEKLLASGFNVTEDGGQIVYGFSDIWVDTVNSGTLPIIGSGDRIVAYPNPCMLKKGQTYVRFANLSTDSVIKIYTIAARLVKVIQAHNGQADWYLKNENEENVARGVYIYVGTNPQGEKKTGKLAIIN